MKFATNIQLMNWLEENGFPFLGEGCGRNVFSLNNDFVIKVPRNFFGLHQNQMELGTFSETSEFKKKFLAQLTNVFEGGMVLVQEKCTPLKSLLGKAVDFYPESVLKTEVLDYIEGEGETFSLESLNEDDFIRLILEGWSSEYSELLHSNVCLRKEFRLDNIGINPNGDMVIFDYGVKSESAISFYVRESHHLESPDEFEEIYMRETIFDEIQSLVN